MTNFEILRADMLTDTKETSKPNSSGTSPQFSNTLAYGVALPTGIHKLTWKSQQYVLYSTTYGALTQLWAGTAPEAAECNGMVRVGGMILDAN